MKPRIVPFAERPEINKERWDQINPWPTFMENDDVANMNWHRLEQEFVDFQFYILDPETDEVLCQANTIPFNWNGDPATLPDGIDAVLPLGIEQHEQGIAPNTLCALQAIVTKNNQGKGLASMVLDGMRDLGRRNGFGDLVAPVRPTSKHLYPLTPMERYVNWTRDDGLPFDPWVRVHARLGGEVVQVCPGSMHITSSVANWESWTSMRFPDTGSYVVPYALVPVQIDRETDVGNYVEPNVWMRHSLQGAP
jgi:hypothetical protein